MKTKDTSIFKKTTEKFRSINPEKRIVAIGTFVFFIVVVYLVVCLFVQNGTLTRSKNEYEEAQANVEDAKAEQEALKAEENQAETDEYIEEKARESGLVQSDEIVFITGND